MKTMNSAKELGNYDKKFESFSFYKSAVYNKTFLKNQKGNFSGYPYRTYVGSTFMGGYSDHFPVYLYLIRQSRQWKFTFLDFVYSS